MFFQGKFQRFFFFFLEIKILSFPVEILVLFQSQPPRTPLSCGCYHMQLSASYRYKLNYSQFWQLFHISFYYLPYYKHYIMFCVGPWCCSWFRHSVDSAQFAYVPISLFKGLNIFIKSIAFISTGEAAENWLSLQKGTYREIKEEKLQYVVPCTGEYCKPLQELCRKVKWWEVTDHCKMVFWHGT